MKVYVILVFIVRQAEGLFRPKCTKLMALRNRLTGVTKWVVL